MLLVSLLRKLRAELPDQREITVQVEDGIHYSELIRVLDVCNLRDASDHFELFSEVSVSATG